MIIFGIRSGKLKNLNSDVYDCGYCRAEKTVNFYFFQKYIHIFWIPIIPIGKTGSSVCRHCHQALFPDQMETSLKQKFLAEKTALKTPVGYKIVLLLMIAFLVLIMLIGAFS